MLTTSYALWGFVIVALIVGAWMVKLVVRRIHNGGRAEPHATAEDGPTQPTDFEHQALVYLMTQKTDAVLAALSRTIEEERHKLGGAVSDPSMDALTAVSIRGTQGVADPVPSEVERILPMVRQGMSEAAIARQLKLPEAEVAMVRRLNAA